MNDQVLRFYSGSSIDAKGEHSFYEVIFLDDETSWEAISSIAPDLPKGWFELSQIDVEERISLTYEFWLSKLPFTPFLDTYIDLFFKRVDDIGIFLTKSAPDSSFSVEMVYSLEGGGFVRGSPPAFEEELMRYADLFHYILPSDYLAFFSIHNGFAKGDDIGIFPIQSLHPHMEWFQSLLHENPRSICCGDRPISPSSLIPFYESKELEGYQCFFTEWLFGKEVGNVFYNDYSISDYLQEKLWEENLSFPTFFHWLLYYLKSNTF